MITLFILLPQVETIGDAYCVASGIHKPSQFHGHQSAWMALKMINTVQTVRSPTGTPLNVSIIYEYMHF